MGGCRCSYKSCRSATKTTENLHFFHYPVKHRDRCAIWIRNADKPEFAILPDYQLRNKVICGLHFEDKYFANVEKRRLVHNAIPTLDAGCDSTSDDLSYIKEVEVLPTSTDGTTFTLHSQHLQPGPSINKKEKFSIQNGKVIIKKIIPSQPEVYTIDPSYFTQSFYNNKNIKEVIINSSYNEDSSDSQLISEEPMESEENCMMIFDTQESNNSDALSIEKQDETGVHFITTSDDATKIQQLFFDDEEEDKDIPAVEIEESKANIIMTDVSDNTNASSASQYSVESNEASNRESSNASSPIPSSTTNQVDTRTVMKRINNHSQEIATIKRSLANNSIRLTNKHLIRSLKGRVPDSLLGAISLHLNRRRNVITKEEQAYANVINSIPAAGNIVLKNKGWYIPIKNETLNA